MVIKWPKKMTGFTLIELIITMVIISVLAVGSVEFVSLTAISFVGTLERTNHSAIASIINEKLTRQIRNALPNSVRINSDSSCVEFIPILSASQYLQAPILGSENIDTEIHVVSIDSSLPQLGYVAIYPRKQGSDLFDNSRNPGMISSSQATYTSDVGDASVFNFASGFRFEFESSQKRMFFVSEPNAFCQIDNSLFWFSNYGFIGSINNLSANLPNSLPNRKLIANGLVDNSLEFQIDLGSLQRSSIVSINYQLNNGGNAEVLQVNREVQIRNVP
ncbi:type II secretion system protein [Oceaniserpentilla sp. 4NH20-0058]|uniref:type II secretion system protein n=1 Tax=Oceaniserpentilla sp. 4NH20-0058 TaxID=3127660 RepID=UPI003101E81A